MVIRSPCFVFGDRQIVQHQGNGERIVAVTLAQIARASGVHPSTVDKVIHDRPGISEAVRANVLACAQQLGYQTKPGGRGMSRSRQPRVLAVVLLKFDPYTQLMDGIRQALQELPDTGLAVEYYSVDCASPSEQLRILSHLKRRKTVAGVLISPYSDPEIVASINELVDRNIPVLTIHTDLPESRRFRFIGQDGRQIGRLAAEQIAHATKGQGEVAIFSSSSNLQSALNRQAGFASAVQADFPGLHIVQTVDIPEQDLAAYRATLALLKQHDNLAALFVACGSAGEVGQAIRSLHRHDPVKIVCVDMYPQIADQVRDGIILCAIDQNLRQQGRLALKTLVNRITGCLPETAEEPVPPLVVIRPEHLTIQ